MQASRTQVRPISPPELEQARLLLVDNAWGPRVADPEVFRELGTMLVRTAMGENRKMTWVLRAGRTGVSHFYEKLGFNVSQVAMERLGERA